MNIEYGLRGEYRVVLTRPGGEVEDTGWFKNLILDTGLDRCGAVGISGNNMMLYNAVGTSGTAPAVGQTDCIAKIATSPAGTVANANTGAPNYADQYTMTYTYALGGVVGNVAELVVGWTNGAGNKFSRALVVDAGGVPTTITVTAADQLTVFYRLTVFPPIVDFTSTVTISAVSYSYTARMGQAAQTAGNSPAGPTGIPVGPNANLVQLYPSTSVLGAITGQPTGTPVTGASSVTMASYTNGNFYRDFTIVWLPAVGNPAGGVGCLGFEQTDDGGNPRKFWQYQFTPVIPKDNTKTLTLNFRMTWTRLP